MSEYNIERSWATEPVFYEAPWPEDGPFTPSPYQHAAVEYRIQTEHGIIADAPGLGKTAEGILTSNALEAKRTLVMCPASLRLNWEREIWRWSILPDVSTYPVLKSKDGVSLKHDYVIVSYDGLRNDGIYDALLEGYWDHLICDEAHYLKDPKGNVRTHRTIGGEYKRREYEGIISRCGNITFLTGTPMPNQPIEIYNLVRIADWEAIDRMSVEKFRNYYYAKGTGFLTGWHETTGADGSIVMKYGRYRGEVRNKPRYMPELQSRLRGSCMIRRLKEQVFTQMPQKQWHLLPVEETVQIRKVMKSDAWKKAEKLHKIRPDDFQSAIPIDGAISTARKDMGVAKAPLALAYCKELLNEGVEKLVVCAWHKDVLSLLQNGLKSFGLVYMDGNTSSKAKQEAVDLFDANDSIRVILGQQKPLGLGWTLTRAQDVVFAEFDWVPGNNDQVLDRIHRRGQEGSSVTGHVLIVPDTLEERMMNGVATKSRNIYDALDKRYG